MKAIADIRKVWNLFISRDRRRVMFLMSMVVLMALMETAGVLSILPFLSVLSDPDVIGSNPVLARAYSHFGFDSARDFMIGLGAFSIAFVLASSGFKVVTHYAVNRFVHRQRHSISVRLLSAYLAQPYIFFLSRNSSDLSKAILSETDQLLANLIQPLAQMIAQMVVVVAMVVLILCYDPVVALTLLTTVGALYVCIYRLVRRRLARIGAERISANRERYQACNEALSGIKDVKVTRSARDYSRRFSEASTLFSRHLAANDTLSQAPLYLVEAVGYSCLILVALLLLMRAGEVESILPALGLYGFAAYRLLPAAQIIYRGFAKLRFSSPALDALSRDLGLEGSDAPNGGQRLIVPSRDIRLDKVSFAYPSALGRNVLDQFSLAIPVNTTVGISGRSGAGKSTVMDILLGLLRPDEGALVVDGRVIKDVDVPGWQRAIGYVPQHIFLADSSVAANIAFGVPTSKIDMAAVERAARVAQIHDFIMSLPDGYHTFVGERGVRLSGGQRQRIGIARALYNDPPVLLFDEATSALDDETEVALSQALRELRGQRTMVVVAHKESSLQMCDRVIVVGQALEG